MRPKEIMLWIAMVLVYFALLFRLAVEYSELSDRGPRINQTFAVETYVHDQLTLRVNAMEAYRKDLGRYPPIVNWHDELHAGLGTMDQELAVNTNQIVYLEAPETTDLWGNEFHVIYPATTNLQVKMYSLGPDGVSESNGSDPDDINSWTPKPTSPALTSKAVNAWEKRQKMKHWLALTATPFLLLWPVGVVWFVARGKRKATLERLEAERLARYGE